MKFRERLGYEVRDWRRCRNYHASAKRHAKPKPKPKPKLGSGALVIQRSDLPRPVVLTLLVTALFLMYVLAFGGIL